jgi:hypothetical protein
MNFCNNDIIMNTHAGSLVTILFTAVAFGLFVFSYPSFALAAVGATCTTNAQCNASAGEYCDKITATSDGECRLASPSSPSTPGNQNDVSGGGKLFNPLKATSLEGLLVDILAFIARLGFIVVVVMIIWVGFMFVKAQGNPSEIETAKKALLWTIVGGLILIGAQAIAMLVQATAASL